MVSALMEEDIDFALYYDVEKAIDYAFEGKFVLKMYDYLKICNAKRRHADEFIKARRRQRSTC